eukprot:scaffold282_cov118-Isochrysis_galbana.AAC.3
MNEWIGTCIRPRGPSTTARCGWPNAWNESLSGLRFIICLRRYAVGALIGRSMTDTRPMRDIKRRESRTTPNIAAWRAVARR